MKFLFKHNLPHKPEVSPAACGGVDLLDLRLVLQTQSGGLVCEIKYNQGCIGGRSSQSLVLALDY